MWSMIREYKDTFLTDFSEVPCLQKQGDNARPSGQHGQCKLNGQIILPSKVKAMSKSDH